MILEKTKKNKLLPFFEKILEFWKEGKKNTVLASNKN